MYMYFSMETVIEPSSKYSLRPNTVGKLVELYVLCAAKALISGQIELKILGQANSREEAQR